jgi:transcriptional regulator with XRE-family HTH domain
VKKKAPRKYFKDNKLLIQIGNKLREVRLSKNISQEALANEIGIDYSQVNRMELGKVNFSISSLYRIAKTLEIDPKKLLP